MTVDQADDGYSYGRLLHRVMEGLGTRVPAPNMHNNWVELHIISLSLSIGMKLLNASSRA